MVSVRVYKARTDLTKMAFESPCLGSIPASPASNLLDCYASSANVLRQGKGRCTGGGHLIQNDYPSAILRRRRERDDDRFSASSVRRRNDVHDGAGGARVSRRARIAGQLQRMRWARATSSAKDTVL